MYVEFFAHTGGGKTSLAKSTAAALRLPESHYLLSGKKSFFMRLSPRVLLRTALRYGRFSLFERRYYLKDREFRRSFLVNSYIQKYCSARKGVVFLNDHGFMMSLFAMLHWHRQNSHPISITDEFMRDYLSIVGYGKGDILIYIHISARKAMVREMKRKKLQLSAKEVASLYSTEESAMPVIQRAIESYVPTYIQLENSDLAAATRKAKAFIEKAMRSTAEAGKRRV